MSPSRLRRPTEPVAFPEPGLGPLSRPQLSPRREPSFRPTIAAPTFVWSRRHRGRLGRVGGAACGLRPRRRAPAPIPRRPKTELAPVGRRMGRAQASAAWTATLEIAVVGLGPEARAASSASPVRIRTSTDPVGDSIFYREVPLPFIDAVQDPSRIRWRFGSIDSQEAAAGRAREPAGLRELPLLLGQRQRARARRRLRQRQGRLRDPAGLRADGAERREASSPGATTRRDDGELTFGLLSRVSPDGRYVISTVKDRAVFVARDARHRVLPALLPHQGHPRRLRHRDRHLRAAARRRRPASTCRATRPGAPTASPSSSRAPRSTARSSIADAKQHPARRARRPRVRRRQGALQVRPLPGSLQRGPRRRGRADRGRLPQRHEQLLREVLAGREVDRLLQGRELHAADAGQRALHRPGRRR